MAEPAPSTDQVDRATLPADELDAWADLIIDAYLEDRRSRGEHLDQESTEPPKAAH